MDIADLRGNRKGGGVQGSMGTQARGGKREEGGHVEVKHGRTNLGVDMVILGVDMVNLRRRNSEGGERARGGG